MIPVKDVYTLIEQQPDLKFIRVHDLSNNKLLDIESNSNKDAVKQLQEKEDILKPYGKVYVKAATQSQKNAHFKNCCTWAVVYSNVTPQNTAGAVTPVDPWSQMVQMMTAMKMMREMNGDNTAGMIHPSVHAAELKMKQAEYDYLLKKKELEAGNDDPIKKIGVFAPFVMSALGKKPEEIQSMINMSANIHSTLNNQGARTVSGVQLTTNVQGNFDELQKLSPEEKQKMLQTELDELAGKISLEDMLLLTKSLNGNPEMAAQAIMMMKQAAATKTETKVS